MEDSVVIVGAGQGGFQVAASLRDEGYAGSITLIGEEDGLAAADSFGINPVFPFTVFADAERRIVAVKIGELHADEAAFILDHVQKINAGTMPVETARTLIRDELRRLEAARPAAANG